MVSQLIRANGVPVDRDFPSPQASLKADGGPAIPRARGLACGLGKDTIPALGTRQFLIVTKRGLHLNSNPTKLRLWIVEGSRHEADARYGAELFGSVVSIIRRLVECGRG